MLNAVAYTQIPTYFYNGLPASGGRLIFRDPATSLPKVVYTDRTGSTPAGSTIYLDINGQPTLNGEVFAPYYGDGVTNVTLQYLAGVSTWAQAWSTDIVGSDSAVTGSIVSVASIQDLRALPAGSYSSVVVNNYYPNSLDGGGGVFCWFADTTASDDGGCIIMPNSAPGTGRWFRNGVSSTIHSAWYGLCGGVGTNAVDSIINALFNRANGMGASIVLDPCTAYFSNVNATATNDIIVSAGFRLHEYSAGTPSNFFLTCNKITFEGTQKIPQTDFVNFKVTTKAESVLSPLTWGAEVYPTDTKSAFLKMQGSVGGNVVNIDRIYSFSTGGVGPVVADYTGSKVLFCTGGSLSFGTNSNFGINFSTIEGLGFAQIDALNGLCTFAQKVELSKCIYLPTPTTAWAPVFATLDNVLSQFKDLILDVNVSIPTGTYSTTANIYIAEGAKFSIVGNAIFSNKWIMPSNFRVHQTSVATFWQCVEQPINPKWFWDGVSDKLSVSIDSCLRYITLYNNINWSFINYETLDANVTYTDSVFQSNFNNIYINFNSHFITFIARNNNIFNIVDTTQSGGLVVIGDSNVNIYDCTLGTLQTNIYQESSVKNCKIASDLRILSSTTMWSTVPCVCKNLEVTDNTCGALTWGTDGAGANVASYGHRARVKNNANTYGGSTNIPTTELDIVINRNYTPSSSDFQLTFEDLFLPFFLPFIQQKKQDGVTSDRIALKGFVVLIQQYLAANPSANVFFNQFFLRTDAVALNAINCLQFHGFSPSVSVNLVLHLQLTWSDLNGL